MTWWSAVVVVLAILMGMPLACILITVIGTCIASLCQWHSAEPGLRLPILPQHNDVFDEGYSAV